MTEQGKRDLLIWAGFLLDPEKWNPICPRPTAPPIRRLEFTFDAARAGTNNSGKIGCSNIGLNSRGEIFYAAQLFWERKDFLEKVDGKGSHFKNKTTTLELIGVLLPFLQIPEKLKNQHIVAKVDNIGLENRSVTEDTCASILIRVCTWSAPT